MSKTYNILWIDDEHNDAALLPFIIQAEGQGIILKGFRSFKEGFRDLENDLNNYDVILLDALFFEDETSETPNPAGLGSAINRINELKNQKVFPFFVLSGQTHFTDVTNPILEAFKLRCYNKKNPVDVKELLADIIVSANNQTETQIRHEHQTIFDILKDYPPELSKTLLNILIGIKNGANGFNDELYFTQLRIILEGLFRKANRIGLLHDNCIPRGQVNLTDASLFLAGNDTNHCGVRCAVTHFPKIIAENIKAILFITGAASHTSAVDITTNMNVQEYRRVVNTPYLLYSLTYQLMDVLKWFNEYSKANNDIIVNKSYWQPIEFDVDGNKFHSGSISRIAPNGWGTVTDDNQGKNISIFKDTVKDLGLVENDRIKFTIEEKVQAKNIQKL